MIHQVTTDLAMRDAAAAQEAVANLQKKSILDKLRDQGLSGVEILSLTVKVNSLF